MPFLSLSPKIESSLALGEKVAFTLMIAILWGSRDAICDSVELRHDRLMGAVNGSGESGEGLRDLRRPIGGPQPHDCVNAV
jgi:hypothetical protein